MVDTHKFHSFMLSIHFVLETGEKKVRLRMLVKENVAVLKQIFLCFFNTLDFTVML